MKTFRFRDFKVYQEAKKFRQEVNKIAKRLSAEQASQLRRAALSVVLNIAEGSAKKSDKDFSRFLENALGSVSEVVACLDCALDDGAISQAEFENLVSRGENIAKQLGGFVKKLKV